MSGTDVTVGRTVHFCEEGLCLAAIVTEVTPGGVSLCVLHPDGLRFEHGIPEDAEVDRVPLTWHWPERV